VATLLRRGLLVAVGMGLALIAASAGAERPWRLPRPVPAFSFSVEYADGTPFPTFLHGGTTFVLGEYGERYVIRIDNPTAERVEAVVSVDGRDAISGRVGDYRTQRGYVLSPYGSLRIEGFRRSLHDVATFRFSASEESYSARRGTPENVGVIGVAFFRERRTVRSRPRPVPPLSVAPSVPPAAHDLEEPRPPPRSKHAASGEDSRAPEAPSSLRGSSRRVERNAPEEANNLGTEFGERRDSSVYEVYFERRSREPDRLMTLRYDDADGLTRRGIDVFARHRDRPISPPDPFPAARFAEPPP